MGRHSKKLQEVLGPAKIEARSLRERTEHSFASLRRALALTFGQQRGREPLLPHVRVRRQRSQGWSRVTAHA